MSEDVVLVAGTIFEHQTADGNWHRIPKVTVPGATGEQSEPKEKTTIEDSIRKYGSGLRDAPDKNLTGYYIPAQNPGDKYELDRDLQQMFITRCRAEEEFPMRITFPDLERCEITYKALGYQVDDNTQEDWKTFTVNGKQNSRPDWSDAPVMTGVDLQGQASMTASDTQTVTVSTIPSDAYYLPGIKFETSDSAVLTVTQKGEVTAVTTGTATISAWLNGFEGTLEITVS